MRLSLLIALPLLVAIGPLGASAEEFILEPVTVSEFKAVFGKVESRTIAPARARIGGTIREIRVVEGDEVAKGEVVAIVVDDKIALETAAADARLKALDSQMQNARTELDRAKRLLERGVAAQSRLDQAQTDFDVVLNQVAAAEADKAVIEQRAREGQVLAPTDGRVLTVPVTLGAVILAGEEVARIASGGYFLRLSLPERHAAEIEEGATVQIGKRGLAGSAAAEAGAATSGTIAKIYPEISDGRVIADVEVRSLGDYFVNERTLVRIPVGKRTVLAIPAGAVKTVHGIDYVKIAAGAGEQDVAVVLGDPVRVGDETRIEVLTGLRAGDRVVLP
ncbi:efflux RND transporter periplasmic adaptor subunit [Amorphus sp. MBR-141]